MPPEEKVGSKSRTQNNPNRSVHSDELTAALLLSMRDKAEAHSIALMQLQRDVERALVDLATLTKILRGDERGKDSLIFEIAALKTSLTGYETVLLDVKKALESRAVEEVKGKWDLTKSALVALLAGILAVAGAIITALLKR